MSAAGKRHMARVAELPCLICGARPVEVHHIREGQGAAQRAQDTLTCPLCPEHHRGASGIHGLGRRGFFARYKLDELDLLALTIELLERANERCYRLDSGVPPSRATGMDSGREITRRPVASSPS